MEFFDEHETLHFANLKVIGLAFSNAFLQDDYAYQGYKFHSTLFRYHDDNILYHYMAKNELI